MINFNKKTLFSLNKCYAIDRININGKDFYISASEIKGECYIFDQEGKKIDKVWDNIGGVMAIKQLPYSLTSFLATEDFYSPNNSKNSKLICLSLDNSYNKNKWTKKLIMEFPYLHRFDILEVKGRYYLLACTLKSGENYSDDWSFPGKVYLAELPTNLEQLFHQNLSFKVILNDLPKNHGYSLHSKGSKKITLIASEKGIHLINLNNNFATQLVVADPSSDAILVDIDGDGELEIVSLTPFHGSTLIVYKHIAGNYKTVYKKEHMDFLHAISSISVNGKSYALIGHRGGDQELFILGYNKDTSQYWMQSIDSNAGAANALSFKTENSNGFITTVREKNYLAMYEIKEY